MLPVNLQSNFSLGELSPQMQGFVDLPAFKRGLFTAENFSLGPSGGIGFRQGTYYAADTRLDEACTLIPFRYNTGNQQFVLEFTAGQIRFYTEDGQLQVDNVVTAGSWSAGTTTLTIGTNVWVGNDAVIVSGVSPAAYNGTFILTGSTPTTVSYAQSSSPGTYVSGGNVQGPYQVPTGSILSTNPPISWAQDNDVLYLASSAGTIETLTRYSDFDWQRTPLALQCGPFQNINTTATTLTPSGTGNLTLTASAALFASTDVGRQVVVLDAGDSWNGTVGAYKWGTITTYTSATKVVIDAWHTTAANVTKTSGMISTAAQATFALGLWSDTTGWPTKLTFHEGRLIANGGTAANHAIIGSVIGNFSTFAPFDPDGTVNPDNSFFLSLNTGKADAIQWMVSSKFLVVGTQGAEFSITSQGPGLSPTDAKATQQTSLGGAAMLPLVLDYRILMMQRGGLNLQEWAFAYFVGGYMANWQNQMSSHITYPGIIWLDASKAPLLRAYLLRADGQLVVATDSHEAKGGMAASPGGVLGFTRYIAGGTYAGGDAVIENICVLNLAATDQLWMCVKRTVAGATVRHIEFLTGDFYLDPQATMNNAVFVDSALAYSGAPTSTLIGLAHLNGQSVVGWDATNNIQIGPATVAGGAIELGIATSAAVVGLPYTGRCLTMQIPDLQVQGRMHYPVRAYLRLYQTYGGNLLDGQNYTTQVPIIESAGALYSGTIRHDLVHGSDTAQQVGWEQTSPYPMMVLNSSIDFTAGES